MATTHICPKCNCTDVYFAKKQIITGLGGIYGNRQKEVERPFCRKCDIEASSPGTMQPENKTRLVLFLFGLSGLAVLLPMILLGAFR